MIKISFQDAAAPIIEWIIFFHDSSIVFITRIAVAIIWLLIALFKTKPSYRLFTDSQDIEYAWTVLPCYILIAIGFPSLRLLYIVDEVGQPQFTLKAIGHQWYWSYEYADFPFSAVGGDSYITSSPYRLLDTDHRIVIPTLVPIRILVTSADVLHCWTIPVIGIKADAVPGRLNQLNLLVDRTGLYFGQCREICGSNHRFIPIAIEAIPIKKFLQVILAFVPTDPMFRSIDLINQFVWFNFPELLFFSAGIDPKNE